MFVPMAKLLGVTNRRQQELHVSSTVELQLAEIFYYWTRYVEVLGLGHSGEVSQVHTKWNPAKTPHTKQIQVT